MSIQLELLRLIVLPADMPEKLDPEFACNFPYFYRFSNQAQVALELNMQALENVHNLNIQALLSQASLEESPHSWEPYPDSLNIDSLEIYLRFLENRLIADAAASALGCKFPPHGERSREEFMKQLGNMHLRMVPAKVCEYFNV